MTATSTPTLSTASPRPRASASGLARAPRPRAALALLALLASAPPLAAAGCGGGPEARAVRTTLGREARLFLDRGREEGVRELERDAAGAVALPLTPPAGEVGAGRGGRPLVERIRVTEPQKPPLVLALEVYVDPDPAAEDALHFRSTANRQVVRATEEGIGGRYEGALGLYGEPLALLRDPHGGPWFLPAEGQGVVVVIDPASLEGLAADTIPGSVVVTLAGRARPLAPLPGGGGCEPLVFALAPGERPALRVERSGYAPYAAEVDVVEGAYTLLAVRLAPERRR